MAARLCTVLSVWVLAFTCAVQGVSFKDCRTSGLEGNVVELNLETAQNATLTCSGISEGRTLTWRLDNVGAGTCNASGPCDTSTVNVNFLSPSRKGGESTVTIPYYQYQRILSRSILSCQEEKGKTAQCQIDLIRPARGTCQANIDMSSRNWSLRVNCDVTEGNSSMQRYICVLYEQKEGQDSFSKIGEAKMSANLLPSRPASCVFKQSVNTSALDDQHRESLHRYRVDLYPGQQSVDVTGNTTLKLPNTPQISGCEPDAMVPENQSLTCRCQTSDLGKPEGRLVLSKKPEKGTFSVIGEADKGVSSLDLNTGPLTRQDHQTKLLCTVMWADRQLKDRRIVQVGYPASKVTLQFAHGLSIAEGKTAIFTCKAEDARPDPTLTLSRGSTKMATGEKTLRHQKSVRCEDSGEYVCTASNGMGPDTTVREKLNVTCQPRDLPLPISPVYYEDEGVQFAFDLVANPPPDEVTFAFLGSSESNSTSKEVEGIIVSGRCGRKGETEVEVTCTVTVSNVTSSAAAGFYRGRVKNSMGSEDFRFEVKLNATIAGPSSQGFIVGVAAGAGLAGIAIIVVVVVVVFIRRGKKGSKQTMAFRGEDDAGKAATTTATTTTDNNNGRDFPPPTTTTTTLTTDEEDKHLPTQPLLSAAARGPSGAPADVYAEVQKPKKKKKKTTTTTATTKGAPSGKPSEPQPEPDNVYALVDKSQKRNGKKKEKKMEKKMGKPPAAETACGGGGGGGGGGGAEKTDDHVYGNINALTGVPNSPGSDAPMAAEGADNGHEYNQDGLLYVSMDFKNVPSAPHPPPPPSEEGVLYSAVDFGRTAPN